MIATLDEEITAFMKLTPHREQGRFFSTRIGPGQSWNWFESNMNSRESSDKSYLRVKGIKDGSANELLLDTSWVESLDLNLIQADSFTHLELEWYSNDSLWHTTPQLNFWRVYFEGLPDLAINNGGTEEVEEDTLQQGERLVLNIGIKNIGEGEMKPCKALIEILDEGSQSQEYILEIPLLAEDEMYQLKLNINTRNLLGEHKVIVRVNPEESPRERQYDNNVGAFDFYIKPDLANPILDVSFDGYRISDGDIISPRAVIEIKLIDENPWLRLNDREVFKLKLKRPGEYDFENVDIYSDEFEFIPDSLNSGTNNAARLIWNANFTKEGYYKLNVQAQDESGNDSGFEEYEISFRVVFANSLSDFVATTQSNE